MCLCEVFKVVGHLGWTSLCPGGAVVSLSAQGRYTPARWGQRGGEAPSCSLFGEGLTTEGSLLTRGHASRAQGWPRWGLEPGDLGGYLSSFCVLCDPTRHLLNPQAPSVDSWCGHPRASPPGAPPVWPPQLLGVGGGTQGCADLTSGVLRATDRARAFLGFRSLGSSRQGRAG